MSDETPSNPAEEKPRVRRISNPRPKKPRATAAKKGEEAVAMAEPVVEVSAPEEVIPQPVKREPVKPEPVVETDAASDEFEEDAPQGSGDWPEAETVSGGGSSSEAKRKRRRKKKGKGGQNSSQQGEEGAAAVVHAAVGTPPQQQQNQPRPQQQQHHQQQPQQPRTQLDTATVARRAWKIYLAEISEEGVSLISDQDARELSKRCFRLAELFLEEEARRTR